MSLLVLEKEIERAPVAIGQTLISATSVVLIVNAILLLVYNATAIGVIQLINNAVTAAFVIFLALIVILKSAQRQRFILHGSILIGCLAASLALNYPYFSSVDALKYIAIYVFFFSAKTFCNGYGNLSRNSLVILAVLPLAFALVGQSQLYPSWESFSYFPNANTATIYFAALLFCTSVYLGYRSLVLQVIQVVFFQKIGALLATFLAIGVWNFLRFNPRNLALGLVFAFGVGVAWSLGLLSRFTDVVATLYSDLVTMGVSGILRMTYDDIIARQGTTDLSGYFRIKHWLEIWTYYTDSGAATWLFGYGPGRTPYITAEALIPHNDYLRVLAEYGIISFIYFVYINIYIVFSLREKVLKIFFTVLLVYFFSENLIDNYASMLIFYFFAGVFVRAARAADTQEPAELNCGNSIRRSSP